MTFKRPLFILSIFLFLMETTSHTFAMWGAADDEDNEQARQAVIQQQLDELQPFGVELRDNILRVSLKEDNPTDLGITLASSRELVAHYDVHLDYLDPLSRSHLRLLRCFPKLVSRKYAVKP